MDLVLANHDFLSATARKFLSNKSFLRNFIFNKNALDSIDSENIFKTFIELEPTDHFSEKQLESQITTCLNSLYENYFVIPFSKSVKERPNKPGRKPDFAIIRNDYKEWFIVEVELEGHSHQHVESQIRTFVNGDYNNEHAYYMSTKNNSLVLSKLEKMVSNYPNKTLVIINRNDEKIRNSLLKHKCEILTFQIYQDQSLNLVFRLKGSYPILKTNHCICCLSSDSSRDLLKLKGGKELFGEIEGNQELEISLRYNGKLYVAYVFNKNKDLNIKLKSNTPVIDRTNFRYQIYKENQNIYRINSC